VGFEPTTPGLKVRSSTAELRALASEIVSVFTHPGKSNPPLADPLPTVCRPTSTGIYEAGRTGFGLEPEGRHSWPAVTIVDGPLGAGGVLLLPISIFSGGAKAQRVDVWQT
jgi:hypothetical protein